MFKSNSTRRDVRRAIQQTMEWPDITYTQPDGRRVRVKIFKDPVGEMPLILMKNELFVKDFCTD